MTGHVGDVVFSPARSALRNASAGSFGFPVTAIAALGVVFLGSLSPSMAGDAAQTDWSAGAAGPQMVDVWTRSFASSEGISWLAAPGQITLSGVPLETAEKHLVDDQFVRASSLDPVDLDGDGDLDLVGAAFGDHRVQWWRNDGGRPPAWTGILIESGFAQASSVSAGDVDGDGTVDVAGCAWAGSEVAVWTNGGQGLSWTRQSVATGLAQCHWVDLADLDGDGDLDLLGAAAEAATVAVWMNGGGSPVEWTMQVIDDGFGGARSLVAADLDSDGDLDLIGTALEDDILGWWRNDGGSPIDWVPMVVSDSLPGSHHADAWDMDLDGDLDIVGLGYAYPWLKLFWNDGGDPLTWREEDIGGAIVTPLVVGAGDLDGDGDMDVAATADSWHRVMWWRNNGGPPADWTSASIELQFAKAWPLAIADLDGDGALDVMAGESGGLDVAWWRLTDFVSSGSLESRVLQIPDHVVTVECLLDADQPPGTEVRVDARVGASPDALGPWVPVDPGGPQTLMVRAPAYLQYRLSLSTSDPTLAPIVREVAFEWTSGLESPRAPNGRVHP